MSKEIRSQSAVSLFERHLSYMPHPKGIIRLMQFAHDSAGLRAYKRRVAEALTMLLEDNGHLIFNGPDEAIDYLREHGHLD